MADTKIKFIIDGLAYCVPQKNQLEVLFIHPDDKHEVKLSIKKNGKETEPTRILDTNSSIEILLQSAKPYLPVSAISFDEILNFDKLHGRRVDLLSNPPVRQSLLVAAQAQVYTAKMSVGTFNILRNGKPFKSKKVGSAVGFDYTIQDGGKITISINGVDRDFLYEEDAEYEITFDNDCYSKKCPDDFEEYYKILDGKGVIFSLTLSKGMVKFGAEPACNPGSGTGGPFSLKSFFEQHKGKK